MENCDKFRPQAEDVNYRVVALAIKKQKFEFSKYVNKCI